eukprot:TRINITY_DN44659_c0_g1_i1.p1 TRINITY_DN44659_c0_g1~~TRINITY_DN44659_c0_g1_i1.p1  ORF type:complete len:318 (-),score=45.68 TRINITY_DN44659_c0_g1_i1:81-1034(-)
MRSMRGRMAQLLLVTSLMTSARCIKIGSDQKAGNVLSSRGYAFYKYYLLEVDAVEPASQRAELSEFLLYSSTGKSYSDLTADVVQTDSEGRMVANSTADCTAAGSSEFSVAAAVDTWYSSNISNTSTSSDCSVLEGCLACWSIGDQNSSKFMLRISKRDRSEFPVMGYTFMFGKASSCLLEWKLYGVHEGQGRDQWTELDRENWVSNVSRPESNPDYCKRYPVRGFYGRDHQRNCRREHILTQRFLDMQPVNELPGTFNTCIVEVTSTTTTTVTTSTTTSATTTQATETNGSNTSTNASFASNTSTNSTSNTTAEEE